MEWGERGGEGRGGEGGGSVTNGGFQLTRPRASVKLPPTPDGGGGGHGSTVVSTAASQLQGPRFDSRLGSLSVWSLHVLPVSAWVSSGCSSFLPHSKNVRVRLYWPC